jgi:hypothetical protein
MAKKLLGLSIMWILIVLAILYFVFGVGRVREGITIHQSLAPISCSSITLQGACTNSNCTWTPASCSDTNYNSSERICKKYGNTYTRASCS